MENRVNSDRELPYSITEIFDELDEEWARIVIKVLIQANNPKKD